MDFISNDLKFLLSASDLWKMNLFHFNSNCGLVFERVGSFGVSQKPAILVKIVVIAI